MEEILKNNNDDNIIRAFVALRKTVMSSKYSDKEKMAVLSLIDKIDSYYRDKMASLSPKDKNQEKEYILKTMIMDIVVEINEVISGDNDIFYFVSLMHSRLRDKKIEKPLRRK